MTRETKSAIWSSITGRQPTSAAPTPAPACAASEIGASITRWAPNRSSSPFVTWKRPPSCATSSPTTNTPGSRSSSSCSASFSASAIVSSRGSATLGEPSGCQPVRRCVDVLERGLRLGSGRREREPDRLLDVAPRLLLELLEACRLHAVLLREQPREAQDRVSSAPGVELLGRPEIRLRRRGVRGDAVALRLDQRRAVAGAGTGDRLGGHVPNGEYVVAVDDDAG